MEKGTNSPFLLFFWRLTLRANVLESAVSRFVNVNTIPFIFDGVNSCSIMTLIDELFEFVLQLFINLQKKLHKE